MTRKSYISPAMQCFTLTAQASILAGSNASLGTGDIPTIDIGDGIPGTGLPADAPGVLGLPTLPGVTL